MKFKIFRDMKDRHRNALSIEASGAGTGAQQLLLLLC